MTEIKIDWKECPVRKERDTLLNGYGVNEGSITFQFIPDRLKYLRSVWNKKDGYTLLTEDEYEELDALEDFVIENEVTISTFEVGCELGDTNISESNKDELIERVTQKFIESKCHGNQGVWDELWSFVYDVVDDLIMIDQSENETDN